MKYSVRGCVRPEFETLVVEKINKYKLWRLMTDLKIKRPIGETFFIFEVWVNSEHDKTLLFESLKECVNEHEHVYVNWHRCTHDEEIAQPCIIVEEYRGE